MPTRAGWSLVGAVAGLYAGARILGLTPLAVLATQGIVLLAGAVAWTRTRRPRLIATREVSDRLQVGIEGRVTLDISNSGVRRSPTVSITDSVGSGRRTARFLVAPMAPGASARATYRIPTERRGRYRIGPMSSAVGDPFGLTSERRMVADTAEVVVHPRVHDVMPLPEGGGDDLDYDARSVRGMPEPGGEFHTLRDYEHGDDLRRVHWRSTARRGSLMIRQEEARRRAPVVVLLDTRSGRHNRASFETAVEAAASVVAALDREERPVTLISTSGERLGSPGRRHLATVLDALAVIEPGGPDRLGSLLGRNRASALVAVMGRMHDGDHAALNLLVRGAGLLVVVATGDVRGALPARRGTNILVSVGPDAPFERVVERTNGAMGRQDSAQASGLALAALSAAAALPLLRVFSGASWLIAALGAALVPHVIAAWADRRDRPLPLPVALVSAVVGVAFCMVVVEPGTTFHGLPTASTFDAAARGLWHAPEVLRTAVVPVEPAGAALLLALVALWAVSTTAAGLDRAGGRPLVATAPGLVLFVAVIALGSGAYTAVTAAYGAAVAAYLLAGRIEHLAGSYSWSPEVRRGGVLRGLAVGGLAAGALAVAAGAVVGPSLPGASGSAILDYRELGEGQGPGSWQTISPLVDIRGRLAQNPPTELFTVRSDREAYWRLVALDEFDGSAWVLGRNEAPPAGDGLPSGAAGPVDSDEVRQHFEIGALSSRWLPAAYRPTAIELTDAYVIEEVLTLVAADDLSAGVEYEVVSLVATPGAADLARSAPVRSDDWSRYLALPSDFPSRVTDLALDIVGAAASDSPYDRALALQGWLRDPRRFTYTLDARSGHDSSAIETFLFESRRGYCEQFAGTFAAMARSVGLPARVAVGFTPGTLDRSAGVYRVTSQEAHAWPEVYLSGIGWTAFEPTPGRFEPTPGDPTGTQAERDGADPSGPATTVAPTPNTTAPGGTPPSMPARDDGRGLSVEADARSDEGSGTADVVAAAVLVVALGGAAALVYVAIASLVVVRRRAGRRHAATNRERVTGAWEEAIDRLAEIGIERRPSSTPYEFALRHAPAHGAGAAGPALMDLAHMHTAAVFSRDEPCDDDVAAAWERATRIRTALRGSGRTGPRWRRRLDPRLLRRRPGR